MKKLLVFFLMVTGLLQQVFGQNIGTAEQREALFDTLVNRTSRWEAWSPFKERKNAIDYAEDAEELRDDFVNATSELDIVIALQRLSNLRQDRHLRVDEDFPRVTSSTTDVPIKFWPDFSSEDAAVFVVDTATNFGSYSNQPLNVGDQLIMINGVDVKEYYEMLVPFLRFSTYNGSLWEFAEALSVKSTIFDPALYRSDNTVQYTLQRSNGSNYIISLPYNNENHVFTGVGERSLTGYKLLLQTIDVDMYVRYFEENIIVLLRWKDFEDVLNTVSDVISTAKNHNILNANVIFDISESSGGSGAPNLVRILAQEPFQTTWGNVRIGDYLDDFKLGFSGATREWLDSDVEQARANGKDYSENVPFKLQFFSKTDDGVMDPAEERFFGKIAMISGSNTGSQVDQCAAMMIDNEIPIASFGMPCGGYSNTWEYEPYLNFPEGSDNWFEYHWNIGHTIRPNGEVLEANPALPEYPYDLTSGNFSTYYNDLIKAAEDTLLAYDVSVECNLDAPIVSIEKGRLLTAFNSLYKYQWYKDGELLEGETNRILNQFPSNGSYSVEIVQGLCRVISEAFEWNLLSIVKESSFTIYPNPASGSAILKVPKLWEPSSLRLLDVSGRQIESYQLVEKIPNQFLLYFSPRSIGFYVLEVLLKDGSAYTARLILK